MKKIILSAIATGLGISGLQAQVVNDTVNTTAAYANNVWYSLADDDQASVSATNWHLGLATSMGATGSLTTAVIFNHKLGSLYEVPGSDPVNFSTVDSAGLSTWEPLFNSDQSWASGAFNNTTDLGVFDYGWGNYNTITHGIDANRVFIVELNSGSYFKLMLSSANPDGTYTLTYAALDNSNLTTETIDVTAYDAKNFLYYDLVAQDIIDREPASENWDLLFHQYPSFDYDPPYTVTGIFQNEGVQIAKAYPVNDPSTYEDFGAETFSDVISTIGYNWKSFNGMAFVIADSTVFFVADKAGEVWKVIMTGFGGSATGKYMFSKEKISAAGMAENEAIIASVYPNPSAEIATIVVKNAPDAAVSIYNLNGTCVQTTKADAASLTLVNVNTAELANGVYNVVVTSGTSVNTQKLVVQH
jgi:hypothetical protein